MSERGLVPDCGARPVLALGLWVAKRVLTLMILGLPLSLFWMMFVWFLADPSGRPGVCTGIGLLWFLASFFQGVRCPRPRLHLEGRQYMKEQVWYGS